MKSIVLLSAAAVALCLATPTYADPNIAITIYANNQALVQDSRDIDFSGGRQTIEFKNVSAQIRPETATLNAADMSIIEQNFDYDLLSPSKMMQKAVGHTVTIVRTAPGSGAETREQAEVLSVNEGVVLRIGNRIEVLRDDGLPVRVIFDKVPENLRAEPTLSVSVNAKAGKRPASLRYLTPGLGWRADYVALYDEATSSIDVQGWVTLTNNSGTTYGNADTVLVAGNPQLIGQYNGGGYRGRGYPDGDQGDESLQEAGTESGTRARLGDYYLYPLADRTTIANNQTKQVSFLDVHNAPAQHGYEFRNGWMQTMENPVSAATVYSFSNSAKGGLGDQLPAGVVRFYLRDKKGAPQFIGEHAIGHTPMGSTLSISTGDAFDVKVKTTVDKRERLGLWRWKTSMRYNLTNASPKAVTVRLIQDGLWGDTKIDAESLPSKRRSADSTEWMVNVPANGKAEVTATFNSKY